MATKVRNLAQIAQQAEDAGVDLSQLLQGDDLDPALEKIFGEIGGDTMSRIGVYIYKIMPDSGKEPRIWNGSPDDYDLASLAKRFGSGDYRIKIMGPNDEGKPVLKANQIVPMLLDPAEDQRIEAMRKGELSGLPANQGNGALSAEAIAKIVADTVRAVIPAPVAQPDPFALFTQMSVAMKNLMPTQPQGGGASSVREVLEMARMVNEMRGDGGGNSRGGRNFSDVGLSVVEKLFNKHLETPAALPAPDATKAEIGIEMTPEQLEEVEDMKMALRVLLLKAKSGADPKEVAEEYYELVPDPVLGELGANPQWFEVLCSNAPGLKDYQDWCVKLRSHLVQFAQEDNVLTAQGLLNQNRGDASNSSDGGGGKPAE